MPSRPLPALLKPLEPSFDRIRRSDPFLMSAAIAYNVFFAIVPLAVAFVAALSLVGQTEERRQRLYEGLQEALPPDVANVVIEVLADTSASFSGTAEIVIVIALLVALYSGSRAVYAVIKSIRLMQGTLEERPWIWVRGLGILFTVAAGISLVLGQLLILLSSQIAQFVDYYTGFSGLETLASYLGLPLIGLWTWLVISAIYTWGPPTRVQHPIISGAIATLLVGLGTWFFALVMPLFGSSTLAALGTIGVLLVWVYYMGFIVITVPDLVAGTIIMFRELVAKRT